MKSLICCILLPELILLLAAVAVFVLDLVWLKRQARSRWLPYVALAGLGLAALGLIPSLGGTHVVATMLAADPFAFFFKALRSWAWRSSS